MSEANSRCPYLSLHWFAVIIWSSTSSLAFTDCDCRCTTGVPFTTTLCLQVLADLVERQPHSPPNPYSTPWLRTIVIGILGRKRYSVSGSGSVHIADLGLPQEMLSHAGMWLTFPILTASCHSLQDRSQLLRSGATDVRSRGSLLRDALANKT